MRHLRPVLKDIARDIARDEVYLTAHIFQGFPSFIPDQLLDIEDALRDEVLAAFKSKNETSPYDVLLNVGRSKQLVMYVNTPENVALMREHLDTIVSRLIAFEGEQKNENTHRAFQEAIADLIPLFPDHAFTYAMVVLIIGEYPSQEEMPHPTFWQTKQGQEILPIIQAHTEIIAKTPLYEVTLMDMPDFLFIYLREVAAAIYDLVGELYLAQEAGNTSGEYVIGGFSFNRCQNGKFAVMKTPNEIVDQVAAIMRRLSSIPEERVSKVITQMTRDEQLADGLSLLFFGEVVEKPAPIEITPEIEEVLRNAAELVYALKDDELLFVDLSAYSDDYATVVDRLYDIIREIHNDPTSDPMDYIIGIPGESDLYGFYKNNDRDILAIILQIVVALKMGDMGRVTALTFQAMPSQRMIELVYMLVAGDKPKPPAPRHISRN